jgi:glycosyltransferase involved in cell wall biosynthesis
MRVAIVHYHLRPGGVTRVIENAVSALAEKDDACVVLAGAGSPVPPVLADRTILVEGLNYAEARKAPDPVALVERLRAAASGALGGAPDLWHIHNHSLGKNPAVTAAVAALAASGDALLLQLHDFAEDGRPSLYRNLVAAWRGTLYPQGGRIHYALLNRRDRQAMTAAGVSSGRAHLLPNAVVLADGGQDGASPERGDRLFLYPTRAIRRKNIGEFLLWSALGQPGDRFATTLAPTHPGELKMYRRWVTLAAELKLPVAFETGVGSDLPFGRMLASAHAVVTTSVAEGFGLVFLEPWLASRPLLGRNLPGITGDFTEEGVDLRHLYERLWVPLDWAGAEAFRRSLEAGLRKARDAYRQPTTAQHVDAAIAASMKNEMVDFGKLDEALQEKVVRHAVAERSLEASLVFPKRDTVSLNRETVERRYNLLAYGERLHAIYQAVLASAASEEAPLDAAALLERFLDPKDFCLLRT